MAERTSAYQQLRDSKLIPDFACEAIAKLMRSEEQHASVQPADQAQIFDFDTSTVRSLKPLSDASVEPQGIAGSSSYYHQLEQSNDVSQQYYYPTEEQLNFSLPPLAPFCELVRTYAEQTQPPKRKKNRTRKSGGGRKRKNAEAVVESDQQGSEELLAVNNAFDDSILDEFLVMEAPPEPAVEAEPQQQQEEEAAGVTAVEAFSESNVEVKYVLGAKDARDYLPLPPKRKFKGVQPHKGFWGKCAQMQFNRDYPHCTGRVTVHSQLMQDGRVENYFACNKCGFARQRQSG